MERYNRGAGAASAPSAPAAPANPYFTEGNPSLGVPATQPGPWWFHMITEEMRKVITDAGLTPDHTNLTQLSAAIQALITAAIPAGPSDASETVKGIVELATDAEAQAFTADKIIDGAKLNTAFQGANQSLADNGYQKLPGGLIIQWGRVQTTPASGGTALFPITFPNAVFGIVEATRNLNPGVTEVTEIMSLTTSNFGYATGSGDFYYLALGR
ncbi:hypothetical protein MTYP_01053 [Methylophilaceae bacterium]|nr:hypothetical protein MTYP_01053 [Methylophilaceae bacterium]